MAEAGEGETEGSDQGSVIRGQDGESAGQRVSLSSAAARNRLYFAATGMLHSFPSPGPFPDPPGQEYTHVLQQMWNRGPTTI